MKPILLDFPMPIKTERLVIQPPKLGDGKIVNEAVLETYDALKFIMPWAKTIPSVDDSEEFVRQTIANWLLKNNDEPYLPLFIFDKENMSFIGSAGYHHMNWDIPSFEIGYWLRQSCQGYGFMAETINALTRYAILELKAKRIEIRCDTLNTNSKKIPERLGYQLEATLKNHRINLATNSISDTLIYAKYDLDNLPSLQVEWSI